MGCVVRKTPWAPPPLACTTPARSGEDGLVVSDVDDDRSYCARALTLWDALAVKVREQVDQVLDERSCASRVSARSIR